MIIALRTFDILLTSSMVCHITHFLHPSKQK